LTAEIQGQRNWECDFVNWGSDLCQWMFSKACVQWLSWQCYGFKFRLWLISFSGLYQLFCLDQRFY